MKTNRAYTLAALELSMKRSVEKLEAELDLLLIDLGHRIDLSEKNEGYYWDNCRDIVVRIKNQVTKLKDWVRP
ncbi:MAG TPA: hypothetical protein VGE97_09845 [Nitrososphaera sp.]|jgi:hypothetical protein